MLGFFTKKAEKEDVDQLKNAVQTGFTKVKQDLNSYTQWIKHLDGNHTSLNNEISGLKDELATVSEELENISDLVRRFSRDLKTKVLKSNLKDDEISFQFIDDNNLKELRNKLLESYQNVNIVIKDNFLNIIINDNFKKKIQESAIKQSLEIVRNHCD